jgi:hypothetical protein
MGRLGILMGVGEPLRCSLEAAAMGFKKGEWSPGKTAAARALGGDCGGRTLSAGGGGIADKAGDLVPGACGRVAGSVMVEAASRGVLDPVA